MLVMPIKAIVSKRAAINALQALICRISALQLKSAVQCHHLKLASIIKLSMDSPI
ncbi:MAG: hypothetical protein SOV16_05930 [Anaerobiospirillum succiniciproducens]|uniref:hypothetical protein n=1 Tax=Anaerobiospirillum succiniciproducens TaxID=13335 RepID=UPI002352BCD3|nr:hypothetical protein [Anaerobiospirillum succiniciproducens]MCI6862989.1 hypothetical protein [Anaerobiospirillum succiniciproducens]MDY2798693.1 hypothetical protein [Anaerobiospirillum succiniciproducens]